jgi:hypothetical protein
MKINGPLIISLQEDDTSMRRELHIAFKPAFIQLEVPERAKVLMDYMSHLNVGLGTMDKDDPDRQGMETVTQICENLLEHIRADEIDLEETIVIEIQPTVSITSLITGNFSIN